MNVVLVGFMGSGKTTVGRQLARRLNWAFVDLDEWIETTHNCRISDVFAADGERRFRAMEREAVREVSQLRRVVIALGGGTWMDAENRRLLRQSGRTIYLEATWETLRPRIQGDACRPLVGQAADPSDLAELLKNRRTAYEMTDCRVCVDGSTLEEVISRALDCADAMVSSSPTGVDQLFVPTRQGGYPIIIGSNLSGQLRERLYGDKNDGNHLWVGADRVVQMLHGNRIVEALGDHQRWSWVPLPQGEASKTLSAAGDLFDHVLAQHPTRSDRLLALGGGTTGDSMGFIAATLLRGVRWIQYPTTLLAQVDSSIGGKVGINHSAGKNLIGAFHPPELVLADIECLQTLPDVEFQNGMAEVIKHVLLEGRGQVQRLIEAHKLVQRREPDVLQQLVRHSCEVKAEIVGADELETGRRIVLNLGHTTAHAVESASGGRIPHGMAVGFGLMVMARVSHVLDPFFTRTELREVEALLQQWNFPLRRQDLPVSLSQEEIIRAMQADKKRDGRGLNWVLLHGLGDPHVSSEVPLDCVSQALEGDIP